MRLRTLPFWLILCLAPIPASADGFVTPYVGYDFGGDAGSCPSLTTCESKKTNVGVSLGYMGAGILGIEEDLGYARNFFGTNALSSDNSVLTIMTNLIVGVPLGPIRPYLSAGGGLVRASAESSSSGFGYDLGGGVMLFLSSHAGLRGDYRYFRSTHDISIAGLSINGTKLNFSRASAGLVFRF